MYYKLHQPSFTLEGSQNARVTVSRQDGHQSHLLLNTRMQNCPLLYKTRLVVLAIFGRDKMFEMPTKVACRYQTLIYNTTVGT
jgi:hypothetical protein